MRRREFLQGSLGTTVAAPLLAAMQQGQLDAASDILAKATASGKVKSATFCVRRQGVAASRAFGESKSADDMFLLGSISKPISVAAIMTLFDQGKFRLEDPVAKYIPEFSGAGREKVTLQHLLTHVSGLPDQLSENQMLRSSHAPLSEFVAKTLRTPLLFDPGARYEYSSMGILLATEVAQRISGTGFLEFADKVVFQPLQLKHTAIGLGRFRIEDMVRCQADGAAPESGAGDPTAKEWDWNSVYWRKLGAPWGGVQASAADVAAFCAEFMNAEGRVVRPDTARLMIRNHNREGLTPRGIGFGVGARVGSPGCSERTFGHTGSTGTLAWADPATDTICVVLTSLPARAADHPRKLVSDAVAALRPA